MSTVYVNKETLKQPEGSKLCGHVCLSKILNIPLHGAIQLIGHIKGTKTKDLVVHFPHNSIQVGQPTRYSLCKCRPKSWKCKGDWHWVIYLNEEIFDPVYGYWCRYDVWAKETGLRISSYIEIINPVLNTTHNEQ